MKKKPDLAHRLTDQELAALEKRIAAEYKKAADELTDKINAYFDSFKKWDEEQKALLEAGEITKDYYLSRRNIKIAQGERFEALRDRIAERMRMAKDVANAYINDTTAGIYSLNRNYAAYIIENGVGANVGFDLWDEQTVKRLIVERPDLMPYYSEVRASLRGFDLKKGKLKITEVVTSGIMQGKSIKGLADSLQKDIPTMNRNSAIMSARTAVTGAQNAGRQECYDAAVKMDIEMEKSWLATLDGRTRHDHAMADGQTVAEDKPFTVGGEKLMYPGDPSGSPWNVYNCRCTMIAKVKGVDMSDTLRRARDPETGKSVLIKSMTYSKWAGLKKHEAEYIAKNSSGKEIKFQDTMLKDEKFAKSVSLIKQLTSEFNTKLQEVKVGGSKGAGDVDVSGSIMRLSSKNAETTIHEFAHTISIERQTKFGLYDEANFWKEIKSVQRKYKKDVGDDTFRWISSYEHSMRGSDEFMAEAFTLSIMDEYGIEIPKMYGKDLTYAKQVLDIIKRYFGK